MNGTPVTIQLRHSITPQTMIASHEHILVEPGNYLKNLILILLSMYTVTSSMALIHPYSCLIYLKFCGDMFPNYCIDLILRILMLLPQMFYHSEQSIQLLTNTFLSQIIILQIFLIHMLSV